MRKFYVHMCDRCDQYIKDELTREEFERIYADFLETGYVHCIACINEIQLQKKETKK